MKLTYEDYTVGWVAALSDELATAQALFDEEHESLAAVPGDHNTYSLGRIGPHNVVVAGLPEGVLGTNAAGSAAGNLIRTYPNVRFVFMVGIGGGVPGAGVRLGDIVVSSPQGQTGGIIQYDLGTNVQDTEFARKGILQAPPPQILTALKMLRANARRQGYKFYEYYEEMMQKNPMMRPDFERPTDDNLYEADYLHVGYKADCQTCDPSRIVPRIPRPMTAVHYGLIGSGNAVMRNAILRDRLFEKESILCFEMEAAGLMSSLSGLVIRGISDYCDTHKNKHWQPYAAAVAAAFAKELLLVIPAQEIETLPKREPGGSTVYHTTFTNSLNHGIQLGHNSGNIYYGGPGSS